MSTHQRFSETAGKFVQRKVSSRTVRAMQVFKWSDFYDRLEQQVRKSHGAVRLIFCNEAVCERRASANVLLA